MLFDNVFDDSKSQAGTLDFLRATGVSTVKAFEDSLLLIFRDADPRVANDQNGTVTVMTDARPDQAWKVMVISVPSFSLLVRAIVP